MDKLKVSLKSQAEILKSKDERIQSMINEEKEVKTQVRHFRKLRARKGK